MCTLYIDIYVLIYETFSMIMSEEHNVQAYMTLMNEIISIRSP
jgi:hypothetical protein